MPVPPAARIVVSFALLSGSTLLDGCSCGDPAALEDGGTSVDAGTLDAGALDSGTAEPGTGDAGQPDAGEPDAGEPDGGGCDDHDPCTVDQSGESGCEHIRLAEDAPCDDGLACTLDDRCRSGICSGTLPEAPQVLSRLTRFGTSSGVGVPLGDARVLFADSPTMPVAFTLVEAAPGLPVQSRLVVPDTGHYDQADALIAPAGSRRLAWVDATRRELRLFEIDDGELSPGATLDLGSTSPQPKLVSATEDDVWICADDFLAAASVVRRISIRTPEAPADMGGMVLPWRCLALAATDDQVFVSTSTGAVVIEVPEELSEPPTLGASFSPAVSTLHAARGLVLAAGGQGARVYAASDLSELAFVPGLVAGGVIVDEGIVLTRPTSGQAGNSAMELALYGLEPNGPALLDEVLLLDLDYAFQPEVDRLRTDGVTVVESFTRRTFQVDEGVLVELRSPRHGAAFSMRVEEDEVVTRGRYNASRFLLEGTQLREAASAAIVEPKLTLELRGDVPVGYARHVQPSPFEDAFSHATSVSAPVRLAVRRFSEAEEPETVEEVTLPGGEAIWRMVGADLYRAAVVQPAAGRVRVDVYRGAALATGNGTPERTYDVLPSALPPLPTGYRVHVALDVDPDIGRMAVAVAGHPSATTSAGALFVVDLESGAVLAEGALDLAPQSVALDGERVAVCDAYLALATYTQDGDALAEHARTDPEADCMALFGLRGPLLHVSTPRGVDVRSFAAPAHVIAHYPLESSVHSATWLPKGMLVATDAELALLEPVCGSGP